jgi:hypothetical protein
MVGCGVVFKLTAAGQETILHEFQNSDGSYPQGSLVFENGYLYGTAGAGGSKSGGVAFQLQP